MKVCQHKDQYNHDTGHWDKCSCSVDSLNEDKMTTSATQQQQAGNSAPAYSGLLFCSFCGKSQNEITQLIVPKRESNISICDECIGWCVEIIFSQVKFSGTTK